MAFLFVAEEGIGIGKALCMQLFDDLKGGYVSVGAFCKAIGFYERLGFEKVSEENSSTLMPFTLMVKRLC